MSTQKQYQASPGDGAVTVEVFSLDELCDAPRSKEGADEPFATLNRQIWLETQERVPFCLRLFLQAIENKQTDVALMAGLEIQEIATQMLLEVYTLVADLELTEIQKVSLP
jgi:hypothetical protein